MLRDMAAQLDNQFSVGYLTCMCSVFGDWEVGSYSIS